MNFTLVPFCKYVHRTLKLPFIIFVLVMLSSNDLSAISKIDSLKTELARVKSDTAMVRLPMNYIYWKAALILFCFIWTWHSTSQLKRDITNTFLQSTGSLQCCFQAAGIILFHWNIILKFLIFLMLKRPERLNPDLSWAGIPAPMLPLALPFSIWRTIPKHWSITARGLI